MYWKLAIWKVCSGSVMVIVTVGPSTVLNWDTMTTQGRMVAVGGLIGALYKFLDAFFDNTVARLAAGKPPIAVGGNGNGNGGTHTEMIAKVTTDTLPTTPKTP